MPEIAESDAPALPTLEQLWDERSARNSFPSDLLKGARSAASFFCAWFYGRNDTIFLHEAGVPDIVLIDQAADKLEVMAAVYPTASRSHAGDAFEIAREMVARGEVYDVVVTDGPAEKRLWPVFENHFATFAALTGKLWIHAIRSQDFEEHGYPATMKGIQSWLNSDPERAKFEVVHFALRNASNGVHWVTLRRRRVMFVQRWAKRFFAAGLPRPDRGTGSRGI